MRHPFTRPRGLTACAAAVLAAVLAALASATGCSAPTPPQASAPLATASNAVGAQSKAAPKSAPKLVVLFVIDGLPQRQVLSYRDQLAPDGFARFLERGAWYANAHYDHAFTVTGAGHATVLTGAHPERTGIIGNDWRDPQTGEPVYCTGDTAATYIDHKTQPLDGTSPKNLRVETVGDSLLRAAPNAKVIAMSGKDRGAILPAGQKGTAYMYMGATGQFASSTFYMREHPAWVKAFNNAKPADAYFKAEWKALLPEAAYARSLPDNQPWFGPAGGALPMRFGALADDAPGARFYGSLLRGPFGDALTLDFARAAIAGESLGQRGASDILSISLSGHDYVNHGFGAESRLSHDHVLHLDRLLQSFFQHLDATVGRDNYVAVLTADHGFMAAPEYTASLGKDAGRINFADVMARLRATLAARFGEPGDGQQWVLGFSSSSVLFDKRLIAAKGADLNALEEAARRFLLAEPGFAVAYTSRELSAGQLTSAPLFAQMRKSWHPQVSGDMQFAVKPNWMFGLRPNSAVATHGSPYEFDTHVPILLYGPGWIKPGRVDARVGVVDIAPTIASWLGVAAPATVQGKNLPLP
jgi:predicted AlkP superfamily pyrophosphatase or phosphodiesterase